MKKFLIVLSGARPEILEHCPTDHGKFEGIGGAVLTTSVLAVVSMTFAMHSTLGVPLFLAIPASLIWGLAVMSLDRWLVGTMQADGPRRWRLATPRILMAVLLGMVISTPLVLQIFKSEIDAQIVEIKQERANVFAERQQKGTVGQDISRLRKAVTGLQKVIASEGDVPLDPARDPKIRSLTAERDAQQIQAKEHYDEWQCQLYGGPNCPRKGDGVLAQASESAYDKAKNRADTLNKQIEARKKELTATDEDAKKVRLETAEAELPRTQPQLDAAVKRQSDLQASFDAENKATNGLLIRLQALNEVSGEDLTLRTAHLLLFLLFLLIECLPVTVKLMQRSGNYEKVLAFAAQREFRDARDSFVPRFASRPRSGGTGGSAPVWEIWTPGAGQEPEPPRTTPAPQPRPHAEPTPTLPDTVDLSHEQSSLEDEVLREMPDTRMIRMAESPSSAVERSGRFELFPDD